MLVTMGKKSYFSESDVAPLVKRYNSSTLVTLLREIAKCETAKLDWYALIKSSATGITSAREYQALWRSLAYRVELAPSFDDDDEPLEDLSDLEFELDPVPAVGAAVIKEVAGCVKADMQRHGIQGVPLKRTADQISQSVVQEPEVAVTARQQEFAGLGTSSSLATAVSRGGPTSNDGAYIAAQGDSAATTPPSSTANASAGFVGALSQADKKKRRLWSPEEDLDLIAAVEKCGEGNWASILKCNFNFERSATQLSQRWALIRKRREVQEKAGYKVGAGHGVTEGQPGASQSGMPTVPNPGAPILSSSTSIGRSGHAPSLTGTPGDLTQATQSLPSGALQGPGSNASLYALSTGVGSGSSTVISEAHHQRTSPGIGVSPSRAAAQNISGQRQQQPQNQGSMRVSGLSSSTAAGSGQGPSMLGATGGPHLHAPGHTVRSSGIAAQGSGSSELRRTASPTGMTSGNSKYNVVARNVVGGIRGGASKAVHGPDPMVQAAAVAAGARIAPASAAASLLMAAKSGNVVHIGPGGVPISKLGLSHQAGIGQSSVTARGSGAIVHYIRTGSGVPPPAIAGMAVIAQRPPLQHGPKSQSGRGSGNSPGTHSAVKSHATSVSTTSQKQAHIQTSATQSTKSNITSNKSGTSPV